MIKKKDKYWLCLHIYCKPPFENILILNILPIIDQLIKNSKVSNFFFIRYGEGGPHIRLRLNFKNQETLSNEKINIIFAINNFLTEKKLFYFSSAKKSIIEINYEPEYERYGGELGVDLAEKVFHFSSYYILKIIKSNTEWNYNKAMYTSLILNYLMMIELIGDSKRLKEFYQFSFNIWIQHSIPNNVTKEQNEQLMSKKIENFRTFFIKVKNWLLPLLIKLEDKTMLNESNKFWFLRMQFIKKNLALHKTEILNNTKNGNEFLIYDGYCHMTNNRLGIRNADEPVISYFILQSLMLRNGEKE